MNYFNENVNYMLLVGTINKEGLISRFSILSTDKCHVVETIEHMEGKVPGYTKYVNIAILAQAKIPTLKSFCYHPKF